MFKPHNNFYQMDFVVNKKSLSLKHLLFLLNKRFVFCFLLLIVDSLSDLKLGALVEKESLKENFIVYMVQIIRIDRDLGSEKVYFLNR